MDEPRVLTVADLARRLAVTPQTVRNMIAGGMFSGVFRVTKGRTSHLRIPRESFDRYMRTRDTVAPPPALRPPSMAEIAESLNVRKPKRRA